MRCGKCIGTGRFLGNGMQMIDCPDCDGYGKISSSDAAIYNESSSIAPIDKRSKLYKDSIKEIMSTNPSIKRNDAEKLFDNAYAKG